MKYTKYTTIPLLITLLAGITVETTSTQVKTVQASTTKTSKKGQSSDQKKWKNGNTSIWYGTTTTCHTNGER